MTTNTEVIIAQPSGSTDDSESIGSGHEEEPLTAPFIGSGTGWQYEDMKEHDGLFVILRAGPDHDSKLDLEKFMDLFGLKRGDGNLILDECVVPDGRESVGEGEIRFKQFRDKILSYTEEFSFLCMLILAHGFEDGSFLLSGGHLERDARGEKKVEHKFDENCEFRRTYEDVIEKIQANKRFHGKPKVFFVQTCRGQKTGRVEIEFKSAQDHTAPPSRYIPAHSDTLIMYACYDGYKARRQNSWADNRMLSLLIDELSKAGQDVRKKWRTIEPTLKKIIRKYDEGDSKLTPRLRRQLYCTESYTDGWLMDVCRAVTHRVSQREPRDMGETYRQQPVIWSTLRDNVSFMNMMERKCLKRGSKSSSK